MGQMKYGFAARSAWALRVMWLCGGAALQGCDGSLNDQLMATEPQVMAGANGRVTNTLEVGGSVDRQVNASDMTSWVYLQLASGKEVSPTDPQSSTEWDLALLRHQIKVNGGISGRGGVEVALVAGTAFSALTAAPQSGYVTDQVDSTDDDADPDYAFVQRGTWYDYNVMTHVLTPKNQVYVVRATGGAYYKLQMTGYYDMAGSSGYPTFRWATVAAPQ